VGAFAADLNVTIVSFCSRSERHHRHGKYIPSLWCSSPGLSASSNGLTITCGPESTKEASQVARQPATVKLKRVRRATVGGNNDMKEGKAGKFIAEAASSVPRYNNWRVGHVHSMSKKCSDVLRNSNPKRCIGRELRHPIVFLASQLHRQPSRSWNTG